MSVETEEAVTPRVDWTIWQNAAVAGRFTETRRGGLLGRAQQMETLCQLLPARVNDPEPARVLDLGCGDGILMETVLRQWPGAVGVALDGSAAMLQRATERLSAFPPTAVTCVHADFNDPAWLDALPFRSFDAIISGFAIHHSEDDRKRALYREIFDLLNPGGVFVNIEHVASVSPYGEDLFERAYALNLFRYRRETEATLTYEAVLQEIRARPDKAANRLSPVETQLLWLRDIGYIEVDCYWKHYELAVLAGYRPK